MKLPTISGIKLTKALSKIDFEIDHQTGSHLILRQTKSPFKRITIPNHKEISKGTLRAILRQIGLPKKDLEKIFK